MMFKCERDRIFYLLRHFAPITDQLAVLITSLMFGVFHRTMPGIASACFLIRVSIQKKSTVNPWLDHQEFRPG